MTRSIKDTVKKARSIKTGYDLTVKNLDELMTGFLGDPQALYEVIVLTFKFGYEMGARATEKEFKA